MTSEIVSLKNGWLHYSHLHFSRIPITGFWPTNVGSELRNVINSYVNFIVNQNQLWLMYLGGNDAVVALQFIDGPKERPSYSSSIPTLVVDRLLKLLNYSLPTQFQYCNHYILTWVDKISS